MEISEGEDANKISRSAWILQEQYVVSDLYLLKVV